MTDGNFWNMGGYAAYIWPAYAFVAVGLIGLAVKSWLDMRRSARAVAELRERQQQARKRTEQENAQNRITKSDEQGPDQ